MFQHPPERECKNSAEVSTHTVKIEYHTFNKSLHLKSNIDLRFGKKLGEKEVIAGIPETTLSKKTLQSRSFFLLRKATSVGNRQLLCDESFVSVYLNDLLKRFLHQIKQFMHLICL